MTGSLPLALKHAGAKVCVVSPAYAKVKREWGDNLQFVCALNVPLSWRNAYCGVLKLVHNGVTHYFLDNESYFNRDGFYGYFDDGERFAFFAKALVEAIAQIDELHCDILHCNDWQCALAPVFLREQYMSLDYMRDIKCVMTVHNIKFQGQFSDELLGYVLGLESYPAAANQLRIDDHSINYMKAGLLYTDFITTVSQSYMAELQMPFYGEGLDYIFKDRRDICAGIVNGIDTFTWNPRTDQHIEKTYDASKLANKVEDKYVLQRDLGLEVTNDKPLAVMVGRLTNQKGVGLIHYAIDRLVAGGMQIAILGTGDWDLEDALVGKSKQYPGQVSVRLAFDEALSHRMYAGGDILLMPSEFEPCGLSQMIAMRYGTLPVVRETGGLRDTVIPYNQFTGSGTGFSFSNINADEMADVVLLAADVFWNHKEAWTQLQEQAMSSNFTWHRAANDYLDIYHSLRPDIIRYLKRRD